MWLEGLNQVVVGVRELPWCMAGQYSSGAQSSATARSWPEPIHHAFRAALQTPVCLHECLEALQHPAAWLSFNQGPLITVTMPQAPDSTEPALSRG